MSGTDAFGQAIGRWQGFYALAGGASATLVGLLFIAVSLHLDLFTDDSENQIRTTAGQTLLNFLFILIIALVFSIPDPVPFGVGIPLLFLGVIGVLRTINSLRMRIQQNRADPTSLKIMDTRYLLWGLVIPILSYATMLAAAVGLCGGDDAMTYWLVWVVIIMLIASTNSAWNMLVGLAGYRRWRTDRKAVADAKSATPNTVTNSQPSANG